MKSSEICTLAINVVSWMYGRVAYRGDSTYYDPTDADTLAWYNGLTWWDNAWHADCLGFVRAVLCGWNADKTVLCGGADRSYGCYNFNERLFLDSCDYTSNDFSEIVSHPCSLLYKETPFRHVGLYVGEFTVGGLTYNTCECTTSYIDEQGRPGGGKPAWVDPDGTRRPYKGASGNAGKWLSWGIFNLDETDYGITEYDGGAPIGVNGFGSALTQTEVDYYFDKLNDLTYDYVESIAESVHGMSADVFAVMAGWGWGETYSFAYPSGESKPDNYMGYLCDCCPVNYFEGWGRDTGQSMAAEIAGGDQSGFYDYSAMVARAQNLKTNEATWSGQQELKALLLALLNPNQDAWYCNGYPWNGCVSIYQQQYSEIIYSFYDPQTKTPYDITGTGIRGGWNPTPARISKKYIMLKPLQLRNFYRLNIFKKGV